MWSNYSTLINMKNGIQEQVGQIFFNTYMKQCEDEGGGNFSDHNIKHKGGGAKSWKTIVENSTFIKETS